MTKNFWFSEFRRTISILPTSEINKAEEYYKELFEDKKDAGYTENEIIESFGSPYQAANGVIEEYMRENPDFHREEPISPSKPHSTSREDNRAIWVVLCIVFFFPVAGIFLAMITLAFGLYVGVFAIFATAIGLPLAFIGTSPTIASISAWLGVSLILIAIAIPLTYGVTFLVKKMFQGARYVIARIKQNVMEG